MAKKILAEEVFGGKIVAQKMKIDILEELVDHLKYLKGNLYSAWGDKFDENGKPIYKTDEDGNPTDERDYGNYKLTAKNCEPEKWAEIQLKDQIYFEVAEGIANLL